MRARGENRRERQRLQTIVAGLRLGAQLLGQRTCLARGGHAELALQHGPQRLVGGDRGRSVPALSQTAHEHPSGVLREGIELEPAPGVGRGSLEVTHGLGLPAERLQQAADALPMCLARLQDPVVVEIQEELGPAQRQGLARTLGGCQPIDLPHVDEDLRALGDADPLALGDEVATSALAELSAERRQRRPEARPRAALEHIRPEDRGHACPRVHPRVVRQPGQQRARPAARDRVQPPPLHFHGELAEQVDPQHVRQP